MLTRRRAQAIIIQNNKVLFGKGLFENGEIRHFFIGGGIEKNEMPEETVMRELKEEANVEGTILFEISNINMENHHTFYVDIGKQIPVIGYDPEEEEILKPKDKKMLQELVFLDLGKSQNFTPIDIQAFEALLFECKSRGIQREWIKPLELLVKHNKNQL